MLDCKTFHLEAGFLNQGSRLGVMVSSFRFALFAVRTGADGSSGLRICTRRPAR
jgi:hypothetical protein